MFLFWHSANNDVAGSLMITLISVYSTLDGEVEVFVNPKKATTRRIEVSFVDASEKVLLQETKTEENHK